MNTYIIFASHKSKQSVLQMAMTKDISLIECTGSYKGQTEDSYLVTEDAFNQYIINSGLVDNEESFLHLSEKEIKTNERMGTLIYRESPSGIVELGYLRAVSEQEAKQQDNWTLRQDTNQYYTI